MKKKENGQGRLEENESEEIAKTTDTDVENVKRMLKKKALQTKVLKKIIEQNDNPINSK